MNKISSYFLGLCLVFGVSGAYATGSVYPKLTDWPRWGQNFTNDQDNLLVGLGTGDAAKFKQYCKINYVRGAITTGLVESTSSQPIIVNNVVYWTGFGGYVGATQILRDKKNNITGCKDLWQVNVGDLLLPGLNAEAFGAEPSVRVTPAYYVTKAGKGALLYTGIGSPLTMPYPFAVAQNYPSFAFSLDAVTGQTNFILPVADPGATNPDNTLFTATASPVVYNNIAYIGLASFNNVLNNPLLTGSTAAVFPMTFRGQMIAVDLNGPTPYVKWRQFTLPERPAGWTGPWFAGAGVWSSGPSILPLVGKGHKGIVYFGSGNLYDYPNFVADCMTKPIPPVTFGTNPETQLTVNKQGETGGGALACRAEAKAKLASMGITQPIASSSIIALNAADGSYAWYYPTEGIDAWQAGCLQYSTPAPYCNLPVAGPDWDIGGSAPIVSVVGLTPVVISSSKSGAVFVLNALTGAKRLSMDVCVGSNVGGIHWGLSYNPIRGVIYAPCSGGVFAPAEGVASYGYESVLADGTTICERGYLNAINVKTGKLLWQSVPAVSNPPNVSSNVCATGGYVPDLRFKSGVPFDVVIKNKTSSASVNYMPRNNTIPNQNVGEARMHSRPTIAGDLIFMPVFDGAVYVLNGSNGKYLKELDCDKGALYQGVSVTDDVVSFGCGYTGTGDATGAGNNIMVFGLPH